MGNDYSNYDGIIIVLCFGILIFFAVVALVVTKLIPFFRERKRIKLEMERSFGKHEYRYWKRKLKKLYLTSIPIIGRFWE